MERLKQTAAWIIAAICFYAFIVALAHKVESKPVVQPKPPVLYIDGGAE